MSLRMKLALSAMVIAGVILTEPKFLMLVEHLGRQIPQKNMRLDYIKGLMWAVFLGLTIFAWPIRSQDKRALLLIWSVKCFVMLVLMLFYEYRYQTDAFGIFGQTSQGGSVDWKAMYFSEIRANLPVTFVVMPHQNSFLNSYHAIKVSFGMIGLAAVYIFYRSVVIFLRQEKLGLLYVLALFPSMLFWSSIIGKDPIVFLGIAVYCYGAVRWIRRRSLSSIIILLPGILLAVTIRSYLGFILGFPILIATILEIMRKHRRFRILTVFILALTVAFSVDWGIKNFGFKSLKNLPQFATIVYRNFGMGGSGRVANMPVAAIPQGVNAKDKVSVKSEKVMGFNSLRDIIIYIPKGMFTDLFRPLPGDVNNIFGFFAGIEGAFLLVLFVIAVKRMRWRKLADPVIIWAVLLVATWSGAYSLIGNNLGTISRYRLQILPVFLCLLFYLIWHGPELNSRRRI